MGKPLQVAIAANVCEHTRISPPRLEPLGHPHPAADHENTHGHTRIGVQQVGRASSCSPELRELAPPGVRSPRRASWPTGRPLCRRQACRGSH
eukprot:9073102-Alexandrium_andersonii.AAC.1